MSYLCSKFSGLNRVLFEEGEGGQREDRIEKIFYVQIGM